MQLADRKCVACEGGAQPMSHEDAMELGTHIPEWTIWPKRVERTFSVKDFMTAMDLANKIAAIAEEENHHPDLHISWGKVRVELSTHSVGGLSENDFIVAAKIDRTTNP